MKQSMTLRDFPRPSVARTLSVNGRVHHMARYRAAQAVQSHVKIVATMDGLRPMHGLVSVGVTYVLPVHRKRDQDNFSTGVTKAVLDALVRCKVLEADDSEHVQLLPVQIVVEKGRRALVVEMEAMGC